MRQQKYLEIKEQNEIERLVKMEMRQDSFRTDATASMSIGPGQSPNQFVSMAKGSPSIKSSLKRPTIKINVGK